MAYRWKRGESVSKAVRRVAESQVERALEALAGPHRDEAVHDARTSIKRLRGLLRMLGPGLGRRGRKDERRLRDLAGHLAPVRDAQVAVQTLDQLWGPQPGDGAGAPPGSALGEVRARLIQRSDRAEEQLHGKASLARVERDFRKLRKRVRRWRPRPPHRRGGWAAIERGLTKTYASGRRWFRRAYRADGSAEAAFHHWRRRVKDHGYHLQLLADLAPDQLAARGQAVIRLGELLGLDHDLAMLKATLAALPRALPRASDRQRVLAGIAERQAALRAEARPLGQDLYADPPAIFRKRMLAHWDRWRQQPATGKPPSQARSIQTSGDAEGHAGPTNRTGRPPARAPVRPFLAGPPEPTGH